MITKLISKTIDGTKVSGEELPKPEGFDIIGDVHGYAEELTALLKQLDYKEINGVYIHDKRKAVFVGDFTCRGPETRRTISIIRKMVENQTGYAVIGNHELNVIGHFTKNDEGKTFKPATGSNKKIMDRIKQEYLYEKELLKDDLKWIRRLPFFLDFGTFKVTHAYWSDHNKSIINEKLQNKKLTKKLLQKIFDHDSPFAEAVRQTTRGIEINLPHDLIIKDDRNIRRTNFRIRWWQDPTGKTFKEISYGNKFTLPTYTVPPEILFPFKVYTEKEVPVFVGHYCMPSDRMLPSPNVCCVDNCVANGGLLAAYRWKNGEQLKITNFVFQEKKG
ncbi:metallophosphoesterase [Marinilabilia salmonicolor]|jgi:hypothetical protein|uniref:Calcineurin-like phosphoesterase family protein n=1 Tax=Marinilabilia salmonicolor TaxID=989 RepID=A0A2T0XQ28_9BACT|nr:metallophosphoesterase [Marinilabilia salmonicolor]PRZ01041.1 calcineurin-like phosphoesterase family protein [Marinilabilia salmonicolor]RCW33954.1 calcineurin-like phosphoesterase family protein [Marinilabilia salmonicolor]